MVKVGSLIQSDTCFSLPLACHHCSILVWCHSGPWTVTTSTARELIQTAMKETKLTWSGLREESNHCSGSLEGPSHRFIMVIGGCICKAMVEISWRWEAGWVMLVSHCLAMSWSAASYCHSHWTKLETNSNSTWSDQIWIADERFHFPPRISSRRNRLSVICAPPKRSRVHVCTTKPNSAPLQSACVHHKTKQRTTERASGWTTKDCVQWTQGLVVHITVQFVCVKSAREVIQIGTILLP